MNKIIVVGHPQSGLERVHELLFACGIAQAQSSRRKGFTPEQISATLLKAHGAMPVQQVHSAEELQQISVAPVWQGLALDLVLANMDQPLWGWADVQAVYLLDYWKAQDPQTMFVLVYDAPQTALIRHVVEHLETDPDSLQAKVNAWVAYNSALLSFHLRNPERSLLVHADQVQASAKHYVQQLSARMDAPLQLPVASQDASATVDSMRSVPQAEAAASSIVHAGTHAVAQQDLQGNPLAQWLAQQLLQDHFEAEELYAQLHAAASVPHRAQQQDKAFLKGNGLQDLHYQAWKAFVAQQTAMQESVAHLHKVQEELESSYLQSKEQAKKLAELPRLQLDFKAVQEKATELQKENELLLNQLYKVQEELEGRYLLSQEQAKKLAELSKLQADLKSGQGEPTKLQQTEAAAQPASTELQEENVLLLSQLHKVQEELERYYEENRLLKAGGAKPQSTYYGAADRVKRQLSYRLGATMIAQSRSVGGWLRMPFALNAEIKLFRQEQAARANQKLPPIAQYIDAHEVERVRQHLSYRLGARMIANSKTLGGWVVMPWDLLGETRAFRKERR